MRERETMKLNEQDRMYIEKNKERHFWVDFAKFVFACGVVGLHQGFPLEYKYGWYVHSIVFRLGVPFFFFCSGFFLRKSEGKNKYEKIVKRIKILGKIYILWNLLYVPYSLYISENFNLYSFVDGMWRMITGRSATVMWFVGTLIWSYLFVLVICEDNILKAVVAFGILYLVGLSFNTYYFLFDEGWLGQITLWMSNTFYSNSNVLFCGGYFVIAGYYLGQNAELEIYWMKQNKIVRLCVLCVMIVMLALETRFVRMNLDGVRNNDYYFMHILVVPSLFIELKNLSCGNNKASRLGTVSTHIYFSHIAVIYALMWYTNHFPDSFLSVRHWANYFAVIGIAVLLSLVYMQIRKRYDRKRLEQKASNIEKTG